MAYMQDMSIPPEKQINIWIKNFGGSLANGISKADMADNDTVDCLNTISTTQGAVEKRNGTTLVKKFSTVFSEAYPLRKIYRFVAWSGMQYVITMSYKKIAIFTMTDDDFSTIDTSNPVVTKVLADGDEGKCWGIAYYNKFLMWIGQGSTNDSNYFVFDPTHSCTSIYQVIAPTTVTDKSVTFTDAGDLVTCADHGFSNGRAVSFSDITTTTGISENVTYYVVGKTTNTFQLAYVAGGSAIALTTNGTGSMIIGGDGQPTWSDTAKSVTFTDTGDLVTLNAHGYSNGQLVSFQTVVTTTGIKANVAYFVVNATINDFQISLTKNGSPIALTTNGTGTLCTTVSGGTVSYLPTTLQLADVYMGKNVLRKVNNCCMYKNTVFVTGNYLEPNNVYFLAFENPFYMGTFAYIKKTDNDGDAVQGVITFMDTVVIFKRESIWALYWNTPEVYSLVKINALTGTLNINSVKQVNNFLYYLGEDYKVYALMSPQTNTNLIMSTLMTKKMNLFKPPFDFSELSKTELDDICALYFENRYTLNIKGTIISFDYTQGSWTVFNNMDFKDYIVVENNLYMVYKNSTLVVASEGYSDYDPVTDTQIAIEAYVQTKDFNFNLPITMKVFRKMYVEIETYIDFVSTVDVFFLCDYGETERNIGSESQIAVWGRAKFGDRFIKRTIALSQPLVVGMRGYTLAVRFENNVIDEPFRIYSLAGKADLKE